jgi:peptidoglycan-N-acetylglucosamine deacetylase
MVQNFFDGVLLLSWVLLGIVLLKIVFFVSLSSRHHTRHRWIHPRQLAHLPLTSVIVPCFNEGKTLDNCIRSLLNQTYDNYEIIIVNDGSTDNTLSIARQLARDNQPRIRIINKSNGGKASALNRGLARSRGDIIVCIDADSMFLHNTLQQLVLSFQIPDVAAVGGNVKVANSSKLLGRQQSLEYITGLTLQRQAFAYLGCMQVISGAIGAFRRSALVAIGGYSHDTIVEDMDTTIELAKRGYKIAYNPQAIAYTEAPENLRDFLKQRYRWTYGSFQVLDKHKGTLWRRQFRRIGFIGMPYFLIAPWLDVFVSFLYFATLLRAITAQSSTEFILVVILMCSLQASLITYVLIADKEDKKLMAHVIFDSLFYYHLISYTTLKAGINYLRRKEVKWNKLERYGKNILAVVPVTVPVSTEEQRPVLTR